MTSVTFVFSQLRVCVNAVHPGSVLVSPRKNVTRVLGHHGNSMCSPSGLVGKPSGRRNSQITSKSSVIYLCVLRKLCFLCGTCQHNSVTSKIIVMMLFFFLQNQTPQFFWICIVLGAVCEDKRDSRPHSAPAHVLACSLHSSCWGTWCCIRWWESGKETFEAGRIWQRAAVCVSEVRDMMRVTRESSAVVTEKWDPDPDPGILLVFWMPLKAWL